MTPDSLQNSTGKGVQLPGAGPGFSCEQAGRSYAIDAIAAAPMVPTVFPAAPERLAAYAQVLVEERYPVMELLGRPIDQALAVLEPLLQTPVRQQICIGLGTINNREAARRAVKLRPDYLIAPAFSRRVLDVAVEAGIPYIPGVRTFQDVQDVLDAFEERDLSRPSLLKLCPTHGLDGAYVRSLCGCFPDIRYCPTGDITLDNYAIWKSMPGIVAPMASQFIPYQWIESGALEAIRDRLQYIQSLVPA